MELHEFLAILAASTVIAAFLFAFCRYPMVFFCLLVIWISFIWRTISIAYLDVAGPLYAYQIYRYVGDGAYSLVFACACLLVLLPFFYFLGDRGTAYLAGLVRESASEEGDARPRRAASVADLATGLTVLLILGLYGSLLLQGRIPLLSGIEQAEFRGEAATFLHNLFMPVQMIFAFTFGSVFTHHYLRTRRFHVGIIAACAAIVAYAVLTGNRFSFFFSFSTMFVAPFAVAVGVETWRRHGSMPALAWPAATFSRGQLMFAGVAIAGLATIVAAALVNSYFGIRFQDAGEAWFALQQRILVQPTELTWSSLQRVLGVEAVDRWSVLDFLFANPIDIGRNTTPQYLMLTYVGSDVTTSHLAVGAQFAGGFPEVFFEALGPLWAWPVVAILGWITAGLVFLVLRAVVLGHFASVLFGVYLLFGLLVMYIGGMVNFAMQATYFAKLALFLTAFGLENLALARGTRLIPWHLAQWREIPSRFAMTLGFRSDSVRSPA